MIEIAIRLVAPACAGGGTGTAQHTATRSLQLDRTVTDEQELERMLRAFSGMVEKEFEELLAEVAADFQRQVAAAKSAKPAAKPAKQANGPNEKRDAAPGN